MKEYPAPEPLMQVLPESRSLGRAVAARMASILLDSPEGLPLYVALSGGSTPRLLHDVLATTFRERLPWDRIHLFWGDERFVPLEDERSNYRMAQETLISKVPIPQENVHPVPVHLATPEEAATAYEETIRRTVGDRGFDMVFLGMGSDGHTASLFPGVEALDEKTRLVHAVLAPEYAEPRPRVTFTLPLLQQAEHVLFLVSGADKSEALHSVQHGRGDLPASRVRARGTVEWFVDAAAFGERGPA